MSANILIFGDIFLTRWADESLNSSPGHWNHCGMYMGWELVLEAQEAGVTYTGLKEFYRRYGQIEVFRSRKTLDREAIFRAGENLIDRKYRKVASVFRFLRPWGGENCVSVVRKCYKAGTGKDPGWKIPDHVWADPNLRRVNFKKYPHRRSP